LELCHEHLKKAWDKLLSVFPDSKGYRAAHAFDIGLLEVKQGKIEAVQKRLDEMRSFFPELNPASQNNCSYESVFLEAELLMAKGSPREAIVIMENTKLPDIPNLHTDSIGPYNMPVMQDVLARAYYANGNLEKATAEYERLVAFNPDGKNRRLIHPKYHLELAKLYEEKGLSDKAIAEYERFLELWKDADPDSIELENAQERLANLKGE